MSIRWDDDPYLFDDPYQGWPSGPLGYTDLIDGLLADSERVSVVAGSDVTLATVGSLVDEHEPTAVVLTCALDQFADTIFGDLAWRGILVRSVHVPHVEYAQSAMVVNYPGLEYPFIRVHETKHASGQKCEGTVLGFEFTGAPTRYYPIEDDRNTELNRRYQEHLRAEIGRPVYFAGRLANYAYIDMDDCMRQALDCATELLDTFDRA